MPQPVAAPPERAAFRGVVSLGFMAASLLCGREPPPGKCTPCSSWDGCEWACIWASLLVGWFGPHVGLKDPFSIFPVRLVYPAFSVALSQACGALCVYSGVGREQTPAHLQTSWKSRWLASNPPPSTWSLLPAGWGRGGPEHQRGLCVRSVTRSTMTLRMDNIHPFSAVRTFPLLLSSGDSRCMLSIPNPTTWQLLKGALHAGLLGWGPTPHPTRSSLPGFANGIIKEQHMSRL